MTDTEKLIALRARLEAMVDEWAADGPPLAGMTIFLDNALESIREELEWLSPAA